MENQLLKIPMQWDIYISILRNPLLWFQLMMVSLISSSYLIFLLVGINLFEYSWEDIPASLSVGLIMAAGLFIALSLILLLMNLRGVPTKYVLQDDYIEQHTLSKISKIASRLGPLAILAGNNAGVTAAGSSLLARSREVIAVEWGDATHLEVFPQRNEIQLHNDWRTIMQVVCPKDQFDNILQFIQIKTEKNITQEKSVENLGTSFAKKVMLSIFSLIFGIFLFPRLPIHYVGIFAIATIIFAYLALWSSGLKQQIFGGILFILPILGVALAFIMGEVDMHRSGSIYALLIEIIIFSFFLILGLAAVFKTLK